MTLAVPYSWLKQIPKEALQKEGALPFGFPPPFPWTELADLFASALQAEDVTFTPQEWQQLPPQSFLKGFGQYAKVFTFDMAPYPGLLWLIIDKHELERFISLLLTKQEDLAHLLHPDYQMGFCEFMALQFFNVFRKLDYAKELTPHLLEEQPLPTTEALYAQDLSFSFAKHTPFILRTIFSEELRHAWKEKYAEKTVASEISISLAEKLSLILHLEAGSTTLTRQQWDRVQAGDFLLLQQCSIDPTKDKGRVMLTLDGRPLYRARLKDGQLKILEFPLYHEVESTMASKDNSSEGFDDAFNHYHEADAENHEADFNAHEEPVGQEIENANTDSEAIEVNTPTPEVEKEPEKVNVANLPLTVVVEVGRLQISVRKLLEIQPGEVLDLDVDPDSGVNLVINGTIVAKGELLKVGESLGVRILDKV